MRKKLVLLIVLIFFHLISYAQLYFQNPSFEATAAEVEADTMLNSWTTCSGTPDILPISIAPWYLPAYQGNTYLGLQKDETEPLYEAEGQYINCSLIGKKNHHFTLYAYEVNYIKLPFLYPGARVQLWGGYGQCALDTLLWQSPVLDTIWQQYQVDFTPNKPYNYVTFVANNINDKHSYMGIDDLSDITVDGYNFFSSTISDTVVNQGKCVTLSAASDDSSATFQWSSIPAGFTAKGDGVKDCPDKNRQYICTATYSCGYQRSDTLHALRVIPTPPILPPVIPSLISVYDNPADWHILNLPANTQIILYNTLGQLVYQSNNFLNNFPLTNLAAATYFYRLTFPSGEQRVGRVVVIR